MAYCAGPGHEYSQEELDNLRAEFGTDRNLVVQYFDWVGGLFQGKFDNSFWFKAPVMSELKDRDDLLTNLHQMIFPVLALAFYEMAFISRVTRSFMMEILREDYMRTARSKGLAEQVVVFRHGLKNAILPILTISGWQFGRLFGGTVVIETIFLIPGMGGS